jgi:hypothetical protein
MPLVGMEPTTSVFERAKTVHALVGVATVIGYTFRRTKKYKFVGCYNYRSTE